MNKAIEEYYKLPENYFNFTTSPPRKANNDFFYLNEILCFGKAGNHKCYSEISADHTITLPDNLNDVINNLRLEKYIEDKNIAFQNNFLTDIYYNTRSYIPNILRHQLQKFSMRNWDKITFPDFPVDTTVENIFESIIIEFLKINQNEKVPF
ncbi:MAG: hypothetical protein Q8903_14095, partial [Bacteroidota bacterium]|nr:hypothetical protein [Bacteroidota bacterium]